MKSRMVPPDLDWIVGIVCWYIKECIADEHDYYFAMLGLIESDIRKSPKYAKLFPASNPTISEQSSTPGPEPCQDAPPETSNIDSAEPPQTSE